MEAICKFCDQNKSVNDFPKGGTCLSKCNSCIAEIQRIKVPCLFCQKLISYGNMSKHVYIHYDHKDNPAKKQVVCPCGGVIKQCSLYIHKKTARHIREMALLL